MSRKTKQISYASVFSTIFFVVGATTSIAFIVFFGARAYFGEIQTTPEIIDTKLSELESRLDKLKAARNTNFSVRMMTDEEKNELWWKIAQVATKTGGGGAQTRYNLTYAQASRISEEYGLSVPNVFEFFRENSTARWRTYGPPRSIKQ